jgi:AcrR family transcriptional regulator
MPRAKQRTPALRDELLRVALATLADDGVAGLTTRRVAAAAGTSTNAVYELFGDKAGLVRALFFEGFRMLGRQLGGRAPTGDARADVVRLIGEMRAFIEANGVLAEVMFSRPFADFDPGTDDRRAGAAVRRRIVDHMRRAVDAGVLEGDPTDIAHVVLSVVHGLAARQRAGTLGTSAASIDRRWRMAVDAVLDGLAPGPPGVIPT